MLISAPPLMPVIDGRILSDYSDQVVFVMNWQTTPKQLAKKAQEAKTPLPQFFADEAELRRLWSLPSTRRALLNQLADAGFGKEELSVMQRLIDAENSDLFDVLEYVSFAVKPISRELRVAKAQSSIFAPLNQEQKRFLEFVLSKYIQSGVEELDDEKLPNLLILQYQAIVDAMEKLGDRNEIRDMFIGFQKNLYASEIG